MHLLIAEHQPDIASVIADRAKDEDATWQIAGDAPTAVSELTDGSYDAVVLDMTMEDGKTVAQAVHKAKLDIPLIVIATPGHDGDVAAEYGASHVLLAPYAFDELTDAFRDVKEKKRGREALTGLAHEAQKEGDYFG